MDWKTYLTNHPKEDNLGTMKEIVEVAVGLPVSKTFHYRIPDKMKGSLQVGMRVLVPFKQRKVTGFVLDLLDHHPWDAKQILYAIDRMPRTLLPYQDIARVHLSLSGTLLETLASPGFQERVYGIVDCG